MHKIGITTDCVCDLPEEYLEANDIDTVYFYITTETGRFRDGYEITSANVLEYLENGGEKAETNAPEPEEYKIFFEKALEKYDEIVHVSVSSQISLSCQNARAALKLMGEDGKKVTVIDSEHLSTGIGYMVIKAVEMRDSEKTAAEITNAAEDIKSKISTTFITLNADYLYRNGRVSKGVRNICSAFQLHPVLTVKNGNITLKAVRIGNYEKAIIRYVRGQLRHSSRIETKRLFITHAGCPVKMISQIKAESEKLCSFEEIIVTKASATISSNCGTGTVGVLFVYN
ncbi:MAG: DegV family protein [Oscillospiraceae bacterium]|nr:DegV family protein [Oscillospiraceae bacterium]